MAIRSELDFGPGGAEVNSVDFRLPAAEEL